MFVKFISIDNQLSGSERIYNPSWDTVELFIKKLDEKVHSFITLSESDTLDEDTAT
jgi:hypothetical protein